MKRTKMLKKNYEFKYVLTRGKYFSGKYIESFILKNNKKNNYLGLAISTKIGKAAKRNHIKRLIRENYKNSDDKAVLMVTHIEQFKRIATRKFILKREAPNGD